MSRSQFGTIQKVKEDKYRIFWQQNGRKKSETVYGSEEEARFRLDQIQYTLDGTKRDSTYSDYWELAVEPTFKRLADKTVFEYRRLWRKELEPRIGSKFISYTSWRMVESVLDEIESPTVQRAAMRLWKKILNMALRDAIITRNPIDRSIHLKEYRKKPKDLYSKEEVLEILEQEPFRQQIVVLLEIGGGLRHEEACAVERKDITAYKEGKKSYVFVRVNKAITTAGGRKIFKDTKNAYSEREVAIGEPFASKIMELRYQAQENYLSQVSPRSISQGWQRQCARYGIRYVPCGQLRSVFSMLHAEALTPDSLVSLAMGHADATTRGQNYMSRSKKAMIVAADSLTHYMMC